MQLRNTINIDTQRKNPCTTPYLYSSAKYGGGVSATGLLAHSVLMRGHARVAHHACAVMPVLHMRGRVHVSVAVLHKRQSVE